MTEYSLLMKHNFNDNNNSYKEGRRVSNNMS